MAIEQTTQNLIDKNVVLSNYYDLWAQANLKITEGYRTDPDSFDEDGKPSTDVTHGTLGYYPIERADGGVSYEPCLDTLAFLASANQGAEGPQGPIGEQGEQGEQGEDGPQGPAGDSVVKFKAQISFSDTPSAAETLGLICLSDAVTFPANFSLNSGFLIGTAPSANYTINIKKYSSSVPAGAIVGSIVINTNRTITRSTVGGTGFSCAAGDTLQFIAQAETKGATNFSEIIVGSYT